MLKAIATADRSYLEMQLYEPGMTALVHHRHRSLFLQADLSQTILLAIVSFAKMGAQTALSFFNVQHRKPPSCWKEHVRYHHSNCAAILQRHSQA